MSPDDASGCFVDEVEWWRVGTGDATATSGRIAPKKVPESILDDLKILLASDMTAVLGFALPTVG